MDPYMLPGMMKGNNIMGKYDSTNKKYGQDQIYEK